MRDVASKPLGRFIVTAPLGGVPVPRAVVAELVARSALRNSPEEEDVEGAGAHGGASSSGGDGQGPPTADGAEAERGQGLQQSDEGMTEDGGDRAGALGGGAASAARQPQAAWGQPFAASAALSAFAGYPQPVASVAGGGGSSLPQTAPLRRFVDSQVGASPEERVRRSSMGSEPDSFEPPLAASKPGDAAEGDSPRIPSVRRSVSAGRDGRIAQTATRAAPPKHFTVRRIPLAPCRWSCVLAATLHAFFVTSLTLFRSLLGSDCVSLSSPPSLAPHRTIRSSPSSPPSWNCLALQSGERRTRTATASTRISGGATPLRGGTRRARTAQKSSEADPSVLRQVPACALVPAAGCFFGIVAHFLCLFVNGGW